MAGINLPGIPENVTLEDLANLMARVLKEIQWLTDGNIDANNVKAKSITAELMKVTELSAIAANLGKVVAGILVGAYIATADGTYPRIEFSSDQNLLEAFLDANNSIFIDPDLTGNVSIGFNVNGSTNASISMVSGNLSILTPVGVASINLGSGKDLNLYAGTGYYVLFDNWAVVKNKASGRTLQQELDSKASSFSGYTGTLYVATTSGGAATHPINVTNGVITS